MSREILNSTIRAYVAKGSGIDISRVIPGQQADHPPDGLYASVYLMSDRPIGRNVSYQYIGETESFTIDDVVVQSVYSVQWYREGALDAGFKFYSWARSETGINWADSAITDGRIRRANVYHGGSGYLEGDTIEFIHADGLPDDTGTKLIAEATLGVDDQNRAAWVYMTDFGAGYWDIPNVQITSADGEDAVISPAGFGFTIKDPFMLRNITGQFADDFEERAQLDLYICHSRNYKDEESGRVETLSHAPPITA